MFRSAPDSIPEHKYFAMEISHMVHIKHICVPGYNSTWSPIRQNIICGVTYYLMESDLLGEDTYHIIMNDSGICVTTSMDGFNPLYDIDQ